ncbi:MAG: glutamate--tRNA ligase [Candidatus Marinimicrobia bacterium]|nr:glutamate--tRNA ligase [Candidatus Neomarinimicrobiota bacterium]|tara:strand:+ start:333 stop:1751 length:1419 start_codon:yes stop_codon:yes gene_type:complete
MSVKVRFAPSPTGYLHVGGLRTALYNYLYAKKYNGKIILRIEDTDQSRKVKGAAENLISSFKSMGIEFDEGPESGGEFGPYFQSQRLAIYKKHIDKLIKNKSAYPCFCSSERLAKIREKQRKNKQIIKYDRHCLGLSKSEIVNRLSTDEYIIRLKIPDEDAIIFYDQVRGKVVIKCSEIDDQVLIKADGFPTYHLANVVDDFLMGVTHVMRGEEWLPSTPKHILLYRAFNWDLPKFIHLPLLLNLDKSKLSKRQGDVAVEDYLANGYLKEALINFVGLLGWHPKDDREVFSLNELKKEFSIKRIQKSGAVFDREKLLWMNKYYLKSLLLDKIVSDIRNFSNSNIVTDERFINLVDFARTRISTLKEFDSEISPFITDLEFDNQKLEILNSIKTQKLLKNIFKEFSQLENWSGDIAKTVIMQLGKNLSLKGKDLFFPVRIALFGEAKGPDLPIILNILGKEKSISRIKEAILE